MRFFNCKIQAIKEERMMNSHWQIIHVLTIAKIVKVADKTR